MLRGLPCAEDYTCRQTTGLAPASSSCCNELRRLMCPVAWLLQPTVRMPSLFQPTDTLIKFCFSEKLGVSAGLQLALLEGRSGAPAFHDLSRGLQELPSFISKLLKIQNGNLETSAFVLSRQNSWCPARTYFAISHFFINVIFISDYGRLQCTDQWLVIIPTSVYPPCCVHICPWFAGITIFGLSEGHPHAIGIGFT